jgi:hypothetical protein
VRKPNNQVDSVESQWTRGRVMQQRLMSHWLTATCSHDIGDDAIRRATPVLVGNFFDVLISIGRWRPVRHFTPPVVPYPCFKVRIGNAFYIESWDRRRKREATAIELAQLQFRSDYGPIILENALNAYFELRPWETTFEPLRAEAVSAVSELC